MGPNGPSHRSPGVRLQPARASEMIAPTVYRLTRRVTRMPQRLWRSLYAIPVSLVVGLGCSNDAASTEPAVRLLEVVQAPSPVGMPGYPLHDSIVVRVVDAGGQPQQGVTVLWVARTIGATATPASVQTDAEGRAAAEWTLGATEGPQLLDARTIDDSVLVLSTDATWFRAERVSANYTGGCAVRTGDIWCWGGVGGFELPGRRNVSRFVVGTIEPENARPVRATRGDSFIDVRISYQRICGLRTGGAVACFAPSWAGDTLAAPVILAAPALRTLTGSPDFGSRMCGLALSDSTAWCWDDSHPATPVSGSPALVDLGGVVGSLGIGAVCGRQVDSTAWCSGMPAPAPEAGVAIRFVQLAVDNQAQCGVRPSHEVWCWNASTVPPIAVKVLDQVTAVSVSDNVVLGIRLGRLIRWDRNTQSTWSPAPVTSLAGAPVERLLTGMAYCVVLAGNEVRCGGEHFTNASGYYNDQFWPLQPVDE